MLRIERMQLTRVNDKFTTCELELQAKRPNDPAQIEIPIKMELHHPQPQNITEVHQFALTQLTALLRYLGDESHLL